MKGKGNANKPTTNDSNHYLISLSLHLDRPETQRLLEYKELTGDSFSKIIREFIYEKMLSKEIEDEIKLLVYKRKMYLKRSEEIRGFK
jgi:hypothetical protein